MNSSKFTITNIGTQQSNPNSLFFDIEYNNELIAYYMNYNMLSKYDDISSDIDFNKNYKLIENKNIKNHYKKLCLQLKRLFFYSSLKYPINEFKEIDNIKIYSFLHNEIKLYREKSDMRNFIKRFNKGYSYTELCYDEDNDYTELYENILFELSFKQLILIYFEEIYPIQSRWIDFYDAAIIIGRKNNIFNHTFLIDFSMISMNKYINNFDFNKMNIKEKIDIKNIIISDFLEQNQQYKDTQKYYLNVIFKEEIF